MNKLVNINNLSVTYSKLNNPTLSGIDFELIKGQKVVILGVSGSGKSTLAKVINGLIPNSYKATLDGTIDIDGYDPRQNTVHDISSKVSTIMQDQDAQFIGMSVIEDVGFILENEMIPTDKIKEKSLKALDTLNITHLKNHTPESLSGGEKQKVSLAGLLHSPAEIMLFDEPLANLDPVSSKLLMKQIDILNKEHDKTILIVEHRFEDCLEYDVDRVIVIHDQTILYNGTVDDILKDNLLTNIGVRKPLYLEYLSLKHIDFSKINNLSNINSFKKLKIDATEVEAKNKNLQSNNLLQIKDLNFHYFEDYPIFKNLNLDIETNKINLFVGKNGSGKSTLAKIFTGINKVTSGQILFENEDITTSSIYDRRNKIGYVLQNPNFMITKNTVEEEILSYLPKSNDNENILVETLTKCNLLKYRKWPIDLLSYGQKRRVTIASVLATKPKLLILDEPTAGQDFKTYSEIMDFILSLKSEHTSIIVITHNMELCLEYGDTAFVFDGSTVIKTDIIELFSNDKLLESSNLEKVSVSKLAHVLNIDEKKMLADYLSRRHNV